MYHMPLSQILAVVKFWFECPIKISLLSAFEYTYVARLTEFLLQLNWVTKKIKGETSSGSLPVSFCASYILPIAYIDWFCETIRV